MLRQAVLCQALYNNFWQEMVDAFQLWVTGICGNEVELSDIQTGGLCRLEQLRKQPKWK
jgi:hypothetical protein